MKMNWKAGKTPSILAWLIVTLIMLLSACNGATTDSSGSDDKFMTYGDTIGQDIDELYKELENS